MNKLIGVLNTSTIGPLRELAKVFGKFPVHYWIFLFIGWISLLKNRNHATHCKNSKYQQNVYLI